MFPQMAPSLHVMHRVVHDKISTDGLYMYVGERLVKWMAHSNLLSLVRQMHQEFELNPPVPEGLAQQQEKRSSMVSNASEAPQFHEDQNCAEPDDDIDIEEEDKAEELAPLVVRSE